MRSRHFQNVLNETEQPDDMEVSETNWVWERGGGRRAQQKLIKEQVFKFCQEVAKDLGGGHSEAVYEQALLRRLYNARIPVLRQVQWFSKTENGDLLSVGYADLEIDHFLIVELKIGSKIKAEHILQLNRYMRAAEKMQSPHYCGAVICFQSSESGDNCQVSVHEIVKDEY